MACFEPSIPSEYRCPVTLEIMKDPVAMPDGFTYDREGIKSWLSEHNNYSPMDQRKAMSMRDARPNITMKNLITIFLNHNKEDEDNGEFQIFIKDISDTIHILWVSLEDSVVILKNKIFKMTNIPSVEQRLLYQQYQLTDNKILKDYNIKKNTTIHLLLRLRGGSTFF